MMWFENPSKRQHLPQLKLQTGVELRRTAPLDESSFPTNRQTLPATDFASSVVDDESASGEHVFTAMNLRESRSAASSYIGGTEARSQELLLTPERSWQAVIIPHDLGGALSNLPETSNDVQGTETNTVICQSHPVNEGSALPPRRRRTTDGLHRAKSALLSLERVPAGYNLHDTVLHYVTTPERIKAALRKLDNDLNHVGWNMNPCESYNGLETQPRRQQIQVWTARLVDIVKQCDAKFEPSRNFEDVIIAAVEGFFRSPAENDAESAM